MEICACSENVRGTASNVLSEDAWIHVHRVIESKVVCETKNARV